MRIVQRCAVIALGLAAQALADLATFSPSTSNAPTYEVGIPTGSSISTSSTGDLYFSLSAPSLYQWVGLGIGTAMRGASIFVMYADGNGNVTLSARDGGRGEVEPTHDTTLQAGITLLAGSGDDGTTMRANVKCTSCTLQSASNSATSPWISAWYTGSALKSQDLTENLAQHGNSDMTAFNFDLSKAVLSSDTNPFVTAAVSPSGTGTASSPSSTASITPGSSDGDGSSSSSSEVGGVSAATQIAYQKSHGIIMGVAVVLLFPIGSLLMRVAGSPALHGVWQIFSLIMLIAGFALGVKLAQATDQLYTGGSQASTHTIFGTVIFAFFLIQPSFGLIHHNYYSKYQSRTTISHVHIWFGRIIMILAIINGGLGLQLAANTVGGEIAYGVIAGVVGLLYAGVVATKRKKTETRWMWKRDGMAGNTSGREMEMGRH